MYFRNRYNISNNDDGTKEIVYAGEVLQQGTPMSAENFNHMEQGIWSASQTADEAKNAADNIGNVLNLTGTRITTLEQKTSDMYSKSEVFEIIVQKVAEIVAGAPADFDTLKEMYDWMISHADSAADMNTDITKNSKDISLLEEKMDYVKSNVALNKSSLGFQRKNLLKNMAETKTINGVMFTVNEDGSVTVNGTATARALRTFLQTAVGYIAVNIAVVDFSNTSVAKTAVVGLCVSAAAAGLAAVMNVKEN